MSIVRTGSRVALAGILGASAVAGVRRWIERRDLYKLASDRARATGRQLVVIGDPNAGIHTAMLQAYGCGDVCVDLAGCPACPAAVTADITRPVTRIADNSAVVFVSCVLEYIPDVNAAVAEIRRMSGSADNLFVATVQSWDPIAASLYPGAQQTIDTRTTTSGSTVITGVGPVGTPRKIAVAAGLGLLAWTALAPRALVPWDLV